MNVRNIEMTAIKLQGEWIATIGPIKSLRLRFDYSATLEGWQGQYRVVDFTQEHNPEERKLVWITMHSVKFTAETGALTWTGVVDGYDGVGNVLLGKDGNLMRGIASGTWHGGQVPTSYIMHR